MVILFIYTMVWSRDFYINRSKNKWRALSVGTVYSLNNLGNTFMISSCLYRRYSGMRIRFALTSQSSSGLPTKSGTGVKLHEKYKALIEKINITFSIDNICDFQKITNNITTSLVNSIGLFVWQVTSQLRGKCLSCFHNRKIAFFEQSLQIKD